MLGGKRVLGAFASAALLGCALLASVPPEKEKLSDLQARFDKESNPVRKAKLLAKLGDAQFEETRRLEKATDYNGVGLLWEKFRDNVRVTLEGLKKQHRDAEKHVGGYRELEIEVREGIRELDQTMLHAPGEYRPPLQIVRDDLTGMDDEVLKMLFPRRTADTPPAKPDSEKQP
jgi:hypothetical protein